MNDLTVVELQGSEAELLSKIKPTYAGFYKGGEWCYSYDESVNDKNIKGAEKVKDGIRELFAVGRDFKKNVGRFVLALYKVYDNMGSVRDFSPEAVTFESEGETYVKSFFRDNGFAYITECLGISKSTAYRYKDLIIFVDEETGEFKDAFKDYAISVLSELVSVIGNSSYGITMDNISRVLTLDCTVEDIREYKKISLLYYRWKEPFKLMDYRDCFCGKGKILTDLTIKEVLEKYHEWERKQAAIDLANKLNGNAEPAAEQSEDGQTVSAAIEPVAAREVCGEVSLIQQYKNLLDEDQRTINQLKSQIMVLKNKVIENLDDCGGCRYNGVKPQKCQCCLRNGKLKDLYEKS